MLVFIVYSLISFNEENEEEVERDRDKQLTDHNPSQRGS